jgi:hypothetical protein
MPRWAFGTAYCRGRYPATDAAADQPAANAAANARPSRVRYYAAGDIAIGGTRY